MGTIFHVVRDQGTIMSKLKCILLIIPILCSNYDIYVGTFNKFKDEKGNFKKALISDVLEKLGLHEAAHIRVHGEKHTG